MKKITFFLSALALTFSLSAQTSLTTAVDFTVTDINGDSHTLFDYLDDGKYVCVDFFAYWCGPCMATAPEFTNVYNQYGCNEGDVIFLGLEYEGTDQQVHDFENANAGDNPPPVASGAQGGGGAAHSSYAIQAFPTFILITTLQGYGLNHMTCTNDVEEAVVEFGVYPVPSNDVITVSLNETGASIELINLVGSTVISTVANELNTQLNVSNLDAGSYLVRVTQQEAVRTKAIQVIK